MRQDKKYEFGTSILTKEQVIALALNSGTELNKKRILDGYKVGEFIKLNLKRTGRLFTVYGSCLIPIGLKQSV